MEEKRIEKGYTISQAADLLGRHTNTIRRYIARGQISAKQLGRSYVIPAEELRKYLDVNS